MVYLKFILFKLMIINYDDIETAQSQKNMDFIEYTLSNKTMMTKDTEE